MLEPHQRPYDYLIIGAGLFGSVFAHEARLRNKRCLVIDKRSHVGGNIYTENRSSINVHVYGPHIFHTNDKTLWDYVNRFAEFNNFVLTPVSFSRGQIFNLPFNMNTFTRLWGITTPREAQEKIKEQSKEMAGKEPRNLEEQAISLVGRDLYETLIKGYTEKQWGRPATELPAFIIKRLPLRFTFDNNYFNDRYQGIPLGGYTQIADKLLEGIEVRLGVDYFSSKSELDRLATKIVYTGPLDEWFSWSAGSLEYRGLRFESQEINEQNVQGNAMINYADKEIPFTRIVEHKHFEFGEQPTSIVTREYPDAWQKGKEQYYPINDSRNETLARNYRERASQEKNVIFGGRLAEYRYYDMHQIIASALTAVKKEFGAQLT